MNETSLKTSLPTAVSNMTAVSPIPQPTLATVDDSPLLSLTPKPLSQMTDDELRERIKKIRARRTSVQTFRAELSAEVANVDPTVKRVRARASKVNKTAEQVKNLLAEYD